MATPGSPQAPLPAPENSRRSSIDQFADFLGSWQKLLIAIGGVILAAGGVFAAIRGFNSGSDKPVLLPVNKIQADAFVPNITDPHTPAGNVTPAVLERAPLSIQTVGTLPGAYGRSGDGVSCNVDALIVYLTDPAHSSEAKTWAGVVGIDPAGIPAYFGGLTPVRLRVDTRVTNYDYKHADAKAFQAVLQAGTSVLVDKQGVPRVKCNCGNPLMEPRGSPPRTDNVRDYARNPEDAWDNFQPNKVTTFSPGPPANDLVLLDLDDGQAYRRNVGSNGANDVAIRPGDPTCTTLSQSTSCGGSGPKATPEDAAALKEAVQMLTKAVRESNCSALIDLMSDELLAKANVNRQQGLANCQQFLSLLQPYGGMTIGNITVTSQNGAHATIAETGTLGGEPWNGGEELIRENGNWKLLS